MNRMEWSLLSSDAIFKRSVRKIDKHVLRLLDDSEKYTGTLFDRAMGPIKDSERCDTCKGSLFSCPGHFGHIDFAVPVIFDFYISYIRTIMEESCQLCNRNLGMENRPTSCPHCFNILPKIMTNAKTQEFVLRTKQEELVWDAARVLKHLRALNRGVDLVFERLVVIPTVKRPWRNFKANEWVANDLSVFYSAIVRCNNDLANHMQSPEMIREQKIQQLKKACMVLFDSTKTSKDDRYSRKKQHRPGLKQQIENKHGVMRGNLMGFRVEHTARTVISANPWLRVDEVGVPIHFANILKVEEVISNRESLIKYRELIKTGVVTSIVLNKERIEITKSNKEWNLVQLSVGDSIFRPLRNGDVILMNRQPTLHMAGFMAHVVRLIPLRVFQLNLSVCPPYNADFDGDEMNAHVLKSKAARMEASRLMWVGANIISPQSSKPCISLIYDSLFGMHEMSKEDVLVPKRLWMDIAIFQDRGQELLTREWDGGCVRGRDLLSLSFPGNFKFKMGDVEIKDGWLVSGVLTKQVLSCHNGIVHCLYCDYSPSQCVDFLSNIQFIITPWLQSRGVSMSVMDGYAPDRVSNKELKSLSGMNEVEIMTYLNEVRDESSSSSSSPSLDNGMIKIIKAGSKGSIINYTQTAHLLGQQTLNGGRVPKQLNNGLRRLPHFKLGDESPDGGGFVSSCFFNGLSPTEAFAHIQSGREGVIDMGIKTGKSGYLARQLIKTQETVQIGPDYTVRSCSKIIQFRYGGDGFKVTSFRKNKNGKMYPIHFDFLFEKYDTEDDGPHPDPPSVFSPQMREDSSMFEYYMSFPRHSIAFCEAVRTGLQFALAEPGMNVGVIAAQCVSEPATQLALNTFHFAGMAGFTTLGFPRIRELSNVTESTPTVTVGFSPVVLKQETLIKDLLYTGFIFSPRHKPQEMWEYCFLGAFHANEPRFVPSDDMLFIELVFYEMVGEDVLNSIRNSHIKRRRIKLLWYRNKVRIYFLNHNDTFIDIQRQLKAISYSFVRGVRGVIRVISSARNELLVDLKRFDLKCLFRMGCRDITSNSTMIIYKNFGIVATRNNLVREFEKVICSRSFVNERHYSLLSDLMCYSGEPDTIQRFGNVHASNQSPIAKATYEQPIKAFTDGAVNKQVDYCNNISTRIAIGVPISGINAIEEVAAMEEEEKTIGGNHHHSDWAIAAFNLEEDCGGGAGITTTTTTTESIDDEVNFSPPSSPLYEPPTEDEDDEGPHLSSKQIVATAAAAMNSNTIKNNFVTMQLPNMFP